MKLLLISKQYVNANNELNYEIDSLNFKYKCYDVHVQTYSLKDVHFWLLF
ncbi:Uncharacterised protein [Kurthia zopfii]|nr:Uncharacterised protein [Kurthia zopfii]